MKLYTLESLKNIVHLVAVPLNILTVQELDLVVRKRPVSFSHDVFTQYRMKFVNNLSNKTIHNLMHLKQTEINEKLPLKRCRKIWMMAIVLFNHPPIASRFLRIGDHKSLLQEGQRGNIPLKMSVHEGQTDQFYV